MPVARRSHSAYPAILAAGLLVCLPLLVAWGAAPTLSVGNPWMRYLLPSIPAAGYLVLRNDSDQDEVLTGASSPACAMLMLHKSQDDSGMAMMMAVPSVIIPAHGSITFAPGGFHLMCMQPQMKIGDKIPVSLSFQGGAHLTTMVPVYGAQNAP